MWYGKSFCMFRFYWLVTMFCPMEEQTRVRREFQADGGGKQLELKRCPVTAERDRHPGALQVNHEPHGNTQNNRHGLIYDIRANQKYAQAIVQAVF